MYRKILVALDNTAADQTVIPHVTQLARLCGAELVLFHVADGWAARHYEHLNLAESEEMQEDRAYLAGLAERLTAEGLAVQTELALGEPSAAILKAAVAQNCDLIAMTSHGHRLLGDIVHGSTIERVRHSTAVPLLIVRAARR